MTETLFRRTMPSPIGTLTLLASDRGLRAVLWPDDDVDRALRHRVRFTDRDDHPVLEAAVEQLSAYFAGSLRQFDVPLDLEGTEFQVLAWQALATIPYGQTASYTEQAARIGRPKAVRAIGAANGRNPVSIILPCHRVVGADGSMTGFAGGIDAKRWLLNHESGQPALL